MSNTPELPGAPHAEAIKSVADVMAMVVKPIATVAQTFADAHSRKKLTKTEIECADLKLRALRNAEITAIRHQQNLEAIAAQAEVEYEDAKKLLPEKASQGESDPDWFHKWAGYAKETSDEDIRALWAKALAGELLQPGKFSLRLLHTVNLLRKADAEVFSTFCNYIWRDSRRQRFLLYDATSLPLLKSKFNGREIWLSDLNELGLTVVRGIMGSLDYEQTDLLCYGGKVYSFMSWKGRAPTMILLTALGRELMDLCDPQPDSEYLLALAPGAFTEFQPAPSPWPWPGIPQASDK